MSGTKYIIKRNGSPVASDFQSMEEAREFAREHPHLCPPGETVWIAPVINGHVQKAAPYAVPHASAETSTDVDTEGVWERFDAHADILDGMKATIAKELPDASAIGEGKAKVMMKISAQHEAVARAIRNAGNSSKLDDALDEIQKACDVADGAIGALRTL